MQATLTSGTQAQSESPRFHLWMGAVFILIAFGGFIPSYWVRVAGGNFHPPAILHIHGMLLFSWTVFYFPRHRAWGMAGISLFSVMICSILVLKVTLLRLDDARGFGDASRRFSAVALCALPLMIAIFSLAIANVRRPDVHKRLMYVLMVGLMIPAIARVFLAVLAPPGALDGGPPPPWVSIPPGFAAYALIIVAMVHDVRTRGRPHPVYIYGGIAVMVSTVLAVVIAGTQTWVTIARYLESLGG
jgi:hypothetical protein